MIPDFAYLDRLDALDLDAEILAERLPEALPRIEENEAYRGTPESVQDLVEAAGFEIVRLERDAFALRFASGAAMLRQVPRGWFILGWRQAIGRDHEREVLAELEQRLDALASREGEVRATVPMLYAEAEKRGIGPAV